MAKMTREKFDAVIKAYYEHKTIGRALESLGIKALDFYNFKNLYPDLHSLYLRARENVGDLEVDRIIDIADTEPDSIRARNMIDVRRWMASKLMPRTYGDRLDVNVTGTVDLTAAMAEARNRLLPNSDPTNIVGAEVIETKQISDSSTTDTQSDSKDATPKKPIAPRNLKVDIFD